MEWAVIVPLIVKYGLPLAEKVWQKAVTGTPPTQADWDELNALAAQNAKDRMGLALTRAGIDPASEQGQKLLNLTL